MSTAAPTPQEAAAALPPLSDDQVAQVAVLLTSCEGCRNVEWNEWDRAESQNERAGL